MSSQLTCKLCVIYCGGTFGSAGVPLTPLTSDVFFKAFFSSVEAGHLTESGLANISSAYMAGIIKDSSQYTPSDFFYIFRQILLSHQDGFTQFIIITGTDTLSYLANFLHIGFIQSSISIMLLASMQPLYFQQDDGSLALNQQSDAIVNSKLAFKHLQNTQYKLDNPKSCNTKIDRVNAAVSGQIIPATLLQKQHSQSSSAFFNIHNSYIVDQNTNRKNTLSNWVGLNILDEQAIAKLNNQIQNINILSCYSLPNALHNTERHLASMVDDHPDAIILLSFGAGNFPQSEDVSNLLTQTTSQGVLVINSTQVTQGGVSSDYTAGSWLYDCGVLTGGEMSIAQIYAQLLWLCALEPNRSKRQSLWLAATV